METKIKSKRFEISDLLSEGWKLYQANFINILLVILCVYIPINVIISFISIDSLIEAYGARGIQLHNNIAQILEFFIGTVATIGIASIVEKSLQGISLSWSDALRYGLSKWPTTIGTGLLAGLILFGLTLLLIIPGIIWSLYYSFWIYVVALRNVGGKAALDYSKSLVKGQWWQVFGTLLVLGIIVFIVALVITIPFGLISDNQFFGIIPDTILDILGAFYTVVMTLFFLNTDYRLKPAQVEQSISPAIHPEA